MAKPPHHALIIALGAGEPDPGMPPSTRSHFAPKSSAPPDMGDPNEPDADDLVGGMDDTDSGGIDQADVKGEPGTGYEGPDGKGAFSCDNCNYFNPTPTPSCGEEHMLQTSNQPTVDGNRKQVDPKGCCEYVDRKGPTGQASGQMPAGAPAGGPPRPAAPMPGRLPGQ